MRISDDSPLVSCIMPTYDRRGFVPQAIHYFLRQDYPNKELIIVDDGPDAIEDLIPEVDGIRYVRLDRKVTLGSKLNLACEHAHGTIIANWDDDDWYAPRRLGYQVSSLLQNGKSLCGINRLLYYDLCRHLAFQYVYPSDQRTWLLGSSLCYTRELWTTNRFADIDVGMDAYFVWGAPPECITVLPDPTYAVHMIHARNVSPKRTETAWWYPYPVEKIRSLLGNDWSYYQTDRVADSMRVSCHKEGAAEFALNGTIISNIVEMADAAIAEQDAGLETERDREIRELRSGVSVIVPHSGPERLPNLGATLANLRQCHGIGEIIVVELGESPCAVSLSRRWADRYLFSRHSGAFERSRALNLGVPLAAFDLVLWLDNDVIVPTDFVDRAAGELRARQLDYLVPFTSVQYLSAPDSEAVRRGVRDPSDCSSVNAMYSRNGMCGVSALVRNAFLRTYGGMSESFRGWGAEDDAWAWKARLLGSAGSTLHHDQHLHHLFHRFSGGYGGNEHIANNPHYEQNVAVYREIRSISDPHQFLAQFPPPAKFSCPWDVERCLTVIVGDRAEGLNAVADTLAGTLSSWYGTNVHLICLEGDHGFSEPEQLDGVDLCIVMGVRAVRWWLAQHPPHGRSQSALAVIDNAESLTDTEIDRLDEFGALAATGEAVAARLRTSGFNPWVHADGRLSEVGSPDDTAWLISPLSLVAGGMVSASGSRDAASAEQTVREARTVWMYWEGECPQWIRECQRTIATHTSDVRLLTPDDFDQLRVDDRDIDLSRLHVAHRADFVRSYLLAKFGGLWIDADCLLMQSLEPVLDLLDMHDYVFHRNRQGEVTNAFIGAARDSRIAAALYQRNCSTLRSGRAIGWTELGGAALTQIIGSTDARCHELECERVQPICWSNPREFFARGDARQHEQRLNRKAICYMLSNQAMQQMLGSQFATDLLAPDTFFTFLLNWSLDKGDNGGDDRPDASETSVETRSDRWSLLGFCVEALGDILPKRVLEIGPGAGEWGMLLRRFAEDKRAVEGVGNRNVHLECVRMSSLPLPAEQAAIYDRVYESDHVESAIQSLECWDLVMFGEEMESWPRAQMSRMVQLALDHSEYLLVTAPVESGDRFPAVSGEVNGTDQEGWRVDLQTSGHVLRHASIERSASKNDGAFLLSRSDSRGLRRPGQDLDIFQQMCRRHLEGGEESASGPGSSRAQTAEIRKRLPLLIADLGVTSLLELPCGDWNWMQHVALALDEYIGGDILPDLVEQNRARFGSPRRQFIQLDLLGQPLPRVDLVLMRDCLVHFSFRDIGIALRNLKRSGSKYLLTTTFPGRAVNNDIVTGDWRPLNFEAPPFNFPPPLRVIVEKCTEGNGTFRDKSLGLWLLNDLPN